MIGILRLLATAGVLAVFGGAVFWIMTAPAKLDTGFAATLRAAVPDAAQGQQVFLAAGCASCHTEDHATGEAKLSLTGGQKFPSDFGTFLAPNISPDPVHGIGAWSLEDFAAAVTLGVSPSGQHYYPAFPYGSYNKMTAGDVADLWAYMRTLPAVDTPSKPHEVGFPFNIRRSLGGWKLLFLSEAWVLDIPSEEAQLDRGRYLVEALGHCGECHTPRNPLGGLQRQAWLAGAPIAGSDGTVPNITPAALEWSSEDIVYYFESGFTPDFDSVGGHMTAVVDNYAQLPHSDRAAVAAYLSAIAPVD